MNIRKIVASENHMLTNGHAYGEVIYLGCNDSKDNWWEITQQEYESIMLADIEKNIV